MWFKQESNSQTDYHWGTSSGYFQVGIQMCVAKRLCACCSYLLHAILYCPANLSILTNQPADVWRECLLLCAKGFWRDHQPASAETSPMPETGAPLGEVSECLNEGRSERLPLRWAPFAGNEELRLRDSPAGRHGNVWEEDDVVGMLWMGHKLCTV